MKNPDHDTMVANIVSVWQRSTLEQRIAGDRWYRNAHRQAAELTPSDPRVGAAVIAAVSPRNAWAQNVRLASRLIDQHAWDEPLFGYLSAGLAKVQRILDGEDPWAVLSSQKVRAFFEGILYAGQTDTVCVDRHAMSIAHGMRIVDADQGMTPKQYGAIASAYVAAAAQVGVPAAIMQATTWVVWRGSAE